MREIKFRAWGKNSKEFLQDKNGYGLTLKEIQNISDIDLWEFQQFTGLKDKNGKEIYEGDIIEFTDKWEWYRGQYAIKMLFADKEEKEILKKQYDNEPMERRVVELETFDGINFSKYDLEQGRWEVIGNIFENPDLIK